VKQLLSIFLAFVILLQTFDRLQLVLYYELFQEQLTQNFCVNLHRPQLMCAAKCYLNDQFEELETNKSKLPLLDAQKQELSHLPFQFDNQINIDISQTPFLINANYLMCFSQNYTSKLLRPPIYG